MAYARRTRTVRGVKTLVVIVVSYALGCLCAAYSLVRGMRNEDIRAVGSGNVGARNAARVLGPWAFVVVFLLDGLKGVVAVSIARYAGLDGWALAAAMVAAVLGHILPVQLSFRGGKGVATSLGALLLYDAYALGVLAACFAASFLVCRRFTASGLIAYALCPFVLLLMRGPGKEVAGVALLAAVILAAHARDIREAVGGAAPGVGTQTWSS
jgi:glycerol-3-phosphate acyltransferase PlsY